MELEVFHDETLVFAFDLNTWTFRVETVYASPRRNKFRPLEAGSSSTQQKQVIKEEPDYLDYCDVDSQSGECRTHEDCEWRGGQGAR